MNVNKDSRLGTKDEREKVIGKVAPKIIIEAIPLIKIAMVEVVNIDAVNEVSVIWVVFSVFNRNPIFDVVWDVDGEDFILVDNKVAIDDVSNIPCLGIQEQIDAVGKPASIAAPSMVQPVIRNVGILVIIWIVNVFHLGKLTVDGKNAPLYRIFSAKRVQRVVNLSMVVDIVVRTVINSVLIQAG